MTHPHEYNWVLGRYDRIAFPNRATLYLRQTVK